MYRESIPRLLIGGLVLLILACLFYWPALHGDWVWDDVSIYIVENRLLAANDGWWRFWFTTDPPDYYPLTYTTFWVEYRLWGLNTTGYHVVNILLHAVNVVLVWWLMHLLGVPGAWWVAALFAVHPMNVESVAWISQRKSLLAATFGFASVAVWLRDQSSPRRWRGIVAPLFFALSLAAKPTLIGLPILLVLYHGYKNSRITWKDARASMPFFVIAIIFGLIGVWFQYARTIGVDAVREQSMGMRLATGGWAATFYVWKSLVPWPLLFVYPRWELPANAWSTYLPLFAWIVLLSCAFKARATWGRPVLLALVPFLVTLAPALGLVDVYFWRYSYVADHYIYQSLPLMLAGVVWLAYQVGRRWQFAQPITPARVGLAFGLVAVVIGAVLTWHQASIYVNEESVWRSTLRGNPHAWMAHNNLGSVLVASGRAQEAPAAFRAALEIKPDLLEARINLGDTLSRLGEIREAEAEFQKALAQDPNSPHAHHGLGALALRRGDTAGAAAAAKAALESDPHHPNANYLLGMTLVKQQRGSEAQPYFATAARYQPDHAEAHRQLGILFQDAGKPQIALAHFLLVARLLPRDAQAYDHLGVCLVQLGKYVEALEFMGKALEIDPRLATAHLNMAVVLRALGRIDGAKRHFSQAAALEPDNPTLRANLGKELLSLGDYQSGLAHLRVAAKKNPSMPEIHDLIAWTLATCPDPSTRQPAEAIQFAERACQLTENRIPEMLDTLATAYAAALRFPEAVQIANDAITRAEALGKPDVAQAIARRKQLFEQRKPFTMEK